jgi:Leucine-rich repeat (LRR) protein
VPTELGECSQLEEVDLSQNQILEIPASLGRLRQLYLLNLDANR